MRPHLRPGPRHHVLRPIAVESDGRAEMQGAADQRVLDRQHGFARHQVRVCGSVGDVEQAGAGDVGGFQRGFGGGAGLRAGPVGDDVVEFRHVAAAFEVVSEAWPVGDFGAADHGGEAAEDEVGIAGDAEPFAVGAGVGVGRRRGRQPGAGGLADAAVERVFRQHAFHEVEHGIDQGDVDDAERNVADLFSVAKGGKIMAFDDEKMIGFGTKADGSLMFVLCFKCSEKWVAQSGINFKEKERVLTWFKKEFSSWSDRWHELLSASSVSFIPRPQFYFPAGQTWETQESLTMIGDAAHWMPPFAGEGANVAMQDSFELAEVLTSGQFTDMKKALSHFEKEMVRRGDSATKQTLENTEKMFAKNGLEQMLSFFN